ncbi:MAG: hypothetical protein AABN33_08145 [Acidobacteriota bacterium]
MNAEPQIKQAGEPVSPAIAGEPTVPGESNIMSRMEKFPKLVLLILAIVLMGSSLLYVTQIRQERFGAYHDDGIYVTTAKALAAGEGYRIISLPYEPAQTKYPPFYPFLLSLIWRVYPNFPQNLTWMMMLSVGATISFLALTYRYLVKQGYTTGWKALIIIGMTAINWRTMILATGLYSEMVYAGLSVSVLYLTERYEKQKRGPIAGVLIGVIIGLAFLTRSSGLALLIAVGAYYVLRRQWQRAALVVGVGSLFVIGWIGWCYANKTTAEGVNVAYYTSYLGIFNEIITDLQTQSNASRLIVFLNIAFENFIGGILVSVPLVCSDLNSNWLPGFGRSFFAVSLCFLFFVFFLIVAGFLRHISKGLRLLGIYVLSSLALYLFWLPNMAYDRFLMPLLPFLLLFLITELDRLISLARKELTVRGSPVRKLSAVFISFILLASVSIILYSYGSGIFWSLASLKNSASRAAVDNQAISWINAHTDSSDTLICYRDPMYFLYTGHKAARSFPLKEGVSWQEDEPSVEALAKLIFRMMDEANGRYVILTSSDFELEDQPDQHRKTFRKLIKRYPEKFVPVFESEDGQSEIYRIENNAG